jgi:hypothetical protein
MSICNFERVAKSVYALSGNIHGGREVRDVQDLVYSWRVFLGRTYNGFRARNSNDILVWDAQEEEELSAAFGSTDANGNPDQERGILGDAYPASVRKEKLELVAKAIGSLKTSAPHYSEILELCVHSIIVRDANGVGGPKAHSSSGADSVGIIWLSCLDGVTELDLQELLIHELVHQLLFIEDYLYQEFDYDRMSEIGNFGLTAISLTPRPLDIAIHSLVVASELLIARDRWIGEPETPTVHPKSASIRETIVKSRDSIYACRDADELITPYISELLRSSVDDGLRT